MPTGGIYKAHSCVHRPFSIIWKDSIVEAVALCLHTQTNFSPLTASLNSPTAM